MGPLTTSAFKAALTAVIAEQATAAAGGNNLVSKEEAAKAPVFLQPAIAEICIELPPRGRLRTAAVVARTKDEVLALVDRSVGDGRSAAFVSRAELSAMQTAMPIYAGLLALAEARLRSPADPRAAVADFFRQFSFVDDANGQNPIKQGLPGARTIDVRLPYFPQNRVGVPAGVLAAHDFYYRASGFAGTVVQQATIAGVPTYLLYTSTDGDDRYLEVFTQAGEPLLSARVNFDVLQGIDEVFGRCRYSESMVNLDQPAREQGATDAAGRAALGQVPPDFVGTLTVDQGALSFDAPSRRVTTINIPQVKDSPLAEVAYAAFEFLWSTSLFARLQQQPAFVLGAAAQGVLRLGSFVRNDGKSYEVADWRNREGGGTTLYFDRVEQNRLRLCSMQTNA